MSHSVSLAWDADADAASYNVYRSPDGSAWTKINSTPITGTSYTDSTAVVGNEEYAVRAVSADGVESDSSNIVTVTLRPAAPANLRVTASA